MAKLEWNTHRRDVRKALLIDAIGGGLCDKHGEYFGYGKYGLKDCPFCDIDEYFERLREAHNRGKTGGDQCNR